MNVIINTNTGTIKFSDEIAEKLNLKAKSNVFLFKIKGENKFGFMPASKEQAKSMICATVKGKKGNLYINPRDPSALYIASAMRISGKVKIKVVEQPLKEAKMYILDGTGSSHE